RLPEAAAALQTGASEIVQDFSGAQPSWLHHRSALRTDSSYSELGSLCSARRSKLLCSAAPHWTKILLYQSIIRLRSYIADCLVHATLELMPNQNQNFPMSGRLRELRFAN